MAGEPQAGRTLLERDGTVARIEAVAGPGGRRGFLRDRTVRLGLVILTPIVTLALLGSAAAPFDPLAVGGTGLEPPSWSHPFGTDRVGRDLLSRVIIGGRLSLGVAIVVSILTVTAGIVVGLASGYLGGWVDAVLSRVVEIVLAFPGLLLALAIAALLEPSASSLVIALVSVGWAGHARVVRAMVIALRDRPFVEAARALGCRRPRILIRHIVPNVLPTVVVLATLEMANVILAVSALSFLGLGPQPPTPEWGAMINEGRTLLSSSPHLMLFPALTVTATVLGFNLVGDGVRDVLDPKDEQGR